MNCNTAVIKTRERIDKKISNLEYGLNIQDTILFLEKIITISALSAGIEWSPFYDRMVYMYKWVFFY